MDLLVGLVEYVLMTVALRAYERSHGALSMGFIPRITRIGLCLLWMSLWFSVGLLATDLIAYAT